jgi:arsenite/tail-anchored protein-transporting ATPase
MGENMNWLSFTEMTLFGGKGGVGKTTMACVSALHLALEHPDQKILLISTDPAHSLADALGLPVGDRTVHIPLPPASSARPNPPEDVPVACRSSDLTGLFAWEPDTDRLSGAFIRQHHEIFKKLAERGTYFDEEDIGQFLDLSVPGMDEVMAILEIGRLIREKVYDRIIVDTAPTGHTLRMLELPDQMMQWVKGLDLMQEKHRVMAAHFTRGRPVKDACDIFIQNLSDDLAMVKRLLTDSERTRFIPVTIPEPMAIEETCKLVRRLRKMTVPIQWIWVNRVIPESDCDFCRSRAAHQAMCIRTLEAATAPCEILKIPIFPGEIDKMSGLLTLRDFIVDRRLASIETGQIPGSDDFAASTPLSLPQHPELVLVGGKGGVGKTSVAAAIALHLASIHPSKKILLFSTDPAHSLADVCGIPIGDRITPVAGENLFALEIDSKRLFGNLKNEFQKDVQDLFDRFVKTGLNARMDHAVMDSLIDFAPPGLDEIMALDTILELQAGGDFDILLLDTSPTGHLLRFLQLPDLARQWLQRFFHLLMRYKGTVRMARMAQKALTLAKGIRRIQQVLQNPQKSVFVAVTLAERLPLEELTDLMKALSEIGLSCTRTVVNRIVPPSHCPLCQATRKIQSGYVQKIASRFPAVTLTIVPQFPKAIQGMTDLAELEAALFSSDSPDQASGKAQTHTHSGALPQ